MDDVVKSLISEPSSQTIISPAPAWLNKPTREWAEAAVATLLRWAGDDPPAKASGTPRVA
jgi:hypothetical protein